MHRTQLQPRCKNQRENPKKAVIFPTEGEQWAGLQTPPIKYKYICTLISTCTVLLKCLPMRMDPYELLPQLVLAQVLDKGMCRDMLDSKVVIQ